MGFGSTCNALFLYVLIPATFWYLLYNGHAYAMGIVSCIVFGLSLAVHAITALVVFILCCTMGFMSCVDDSVDACLIMMAICGLAGLVLTIQFSLSGWGLMLALNLIDSGAESCPESGIGCGWLVFLFILHMLMLNSKTQKADVSQNVQPPTPGGGQPATPSWESGRAMLSKLIYDPRGAAAFGSQPSTTQPPVYRV